MKVIVKNLKEGKSLVVPNFTKEDILIRINSTEKFTCEDIGNFTFVLRDEKGISYPIDMTDHYVGFKKENGDSIWKVIDQIPDHFTWLGNGDILEIKLNEFGKLDFIKCKCCGTFIK